MNKVADTSWYYGISEAKSLPLRCPFATVERCPRYYQSLSLLSKTGATSIDLEEDDKLLKKWKGNELWPKIEEHATSVSHSNGKLVQISNFCPEVTFDRFGIFCTGLGTYADELDMEAAHNMLSSKGAVRNHPNWIWSYASEQHYSECPLYSVISHNSSTIRTGNDQNKEPWWKENLSKIIVGIIVALAAALFKVLLT